MASSGWLGAKNFPYAHDHIKCNIYISSITHSGGTLRVVGKIAAEATSSGTYWYINPVLYNIEGNGQHTLLAANENVTYGTRKEKAFDVSFAVPATNTSTSLDVLITQRNGNTTGTLSWTISFDAGNTPPTGLTLTDIVPMRNGFKGTVSITDWGIGGTEAGRYLEMTVSTANGTTANRRWTQHIGSNLSAEIVVDNGSEFGNIIIQPNTEYWLTMYATNGAGKTGNTVFVAAKTLTPFYVDQNGRTKAPNKAYIRQNDRTKNPVKIYAKSNGRTKQIY